MQLIAGGPDIPESLLQAHEDGRIIFFCGAGISLPAGLPDYRELVDGVFSALHEVPDAVELGALQDTQFDRVLGHLESRLKDGRRRVREVLPDLLRSEAPDLTTHSALLNLGTSRMDGSVRIVTTNFDLLFERAGASQAYCAPMLPVPKNSRWHGVVHLHGRLPRGENESELDNLVLSSGDFGLAYLTEGWAARFLSELFRNYSVCFVGYSLGDHVLRYVVDALAADRQRGEETREVYAFAEATAADGNIWKGNGANVIHYNGQNGHAALHQTLVRWADVYRQRAFGKVAIINQHARAHPTESTVEDDFVSRVLWALADPGGLPAEQFEKLGKAASLGWLAPLGRGDDPLLRPDDLAAARPRTATAFHLIRWLCSHWPDPEAFLWAARCPAPFHDRFAHGIREMLKREPAGPLRTAWGLLLSGRVAARWPEGDVYGWLEAFNIDGLSAANRLALRELLAPLLLVQASRQPAELADSGPASRVAELFTCEVVFGCRDALTLFGTIVNAEVWRQSLPGLLPEFQVAVRDALDLLRAIGSADDMYDHTIWSLPSISPHGQNRGFTQWTWLIERLRDAWVATLNQDPERARSAAVSWWSEPYPLFKRLALFAATHPGVDKAVRWLDEVLANDAWWLWSTEVKREMLRALVELAPQLGRSDFQRLGAAIVAGPPRRMFKDELTPEQWADVRDRSIWLRLAELESAGVQLSELVGDTLRQLRRAHPTWQLEPDESDEFSHWIASSTDPGYVSKFVRREVPRQWRALADWLQQPLAAELSWLPHDDSEWGQRCRLNMAVAARALEAAGEEGVWPADRWASALQEWSSDELARRSWCLVAPVFRSMPDGTLLEIAHPLAWWLRSVAKELDAKLAEPPFLELCYKVLALLPGDRKIGVDAVEQAMNSVAGLVAEAVLRRWFIRNPQAGQLLPAELRPTFTSLCDLRRRELREARVVLAAHGVSFFRADPVWFRESLMPAFDWNTPEEARSAWGGFIYSGQLFIPLLAELGPQFLETAGHCEELGQWSARYAMLLTYAVLEPAQPFAVREKQEAFRRLPPHSLVESASTLVGTLNAAGDGRAAYWKERIAPLIAQVWPNPTATDPRLAMQFALLAIAAGPEFPTAVEALRDWLGPVENGWGVPHALRESRLCGSAPVAALQLLARTITVPGYFGDELTSCLDQISQAWGPARDDHLFVRLRELSAGSAE